MTSTARIAALRYCLIGTGVIFTFGIFPLTQLWPSGWSWSAAHSHYLPMIIGVYATLGVCLIAAARDPLANRSLIWFTVWSSVVHAVIMAAEAIMDPTQVGHLFGDVPALILVAVVLGVLTPRAAEVRALSDLGARRAA
jgi:FtsH-binding integral membrane protein